MEHCEKYIIDIICHIMHYLALLWIRDYRHSFAVCGSQKLCKAKYVPCKSKYFGFWVSSNPAYSESVLTETTLAKGCLGIDRNFLKKRLKVQSIMH